MKFPMVGFVTVAPVSLLWRTTTGYHYDGTQRSKVKAGQFETLFCVVSNYRGPKGTVHELGAVGPATSDQSGK